MSDPRSFTSTLGLEGSYLGPNISEGKLPAFVYFSISANESLTLLPYSEPVIHLKSPDLRIFSFTIPGHENGLDKFAAMEYWADKIEEGEHLLEEFIEKVLAAIDELISTNVIDPEALAVGGLSRGGFIATHIAANERRVSTLLGFAPLTRLQGIEEFKKHQENAAFQSRIEPLNLIHLSEKLTHLKHIRFYIGNRDKRVSTDACYEFIKSVAESVHASRSKNVVELFITQSIGHKGHGTSSDIFREGSLFVKNELLKI